MKRLLLIISAMLLIATGALAAGTVDQTTTGPAIITQNMRTLTFECVGDASDGSIPDTATNTANTSFVEGFYLYRVVIENLAADTNVTDDSDVYIKDAGGTDLLNGQGVDQLDDDTRNYIRLCRKDPIVGALTLDVDNQSVNSGEYTITLIFGK